jgi:hypothetical protein
LPSFLVVGIASCTSILGDFDIAPPSTDAAPDETSDSAAPDVGAELDAGATLTSDATADDGQSDATQSDAGVDSAPPPCGVPNVACCPGNVCSGGAQCNGTICACPQNRLACGNACVDLETDPRNCGRCGHDCFGGSCSAHTCGAYTVTLSQGSIGYLFVDRGRAYWTRGIYSTTAGGFASANLDGTDVVTIFDAGFTGTSANGCYGAATALGKAYFMCSNGAQYDVRVCTLPCGAGSSSVVKGGIAMASGRLAADPATGNIYFTIATPYNQAPNGSVFDLAGNRVGAPNQAAPGNIVVANGSIYWLNSGTYSADNPQLNGGVKRVSLASPTVENVVVTAGNTYVDLSALAVDTHNVYYTAPGQRTLLVAGTSASGVLPSIFTPLGGYSVASDDTNVYFDDITNSALKYCSRASGCGSGPTTLSPNETLVVAIYLEADSVIWGSYGGGIRRIAKP